MVKHLPKEIVAVALNGNNSIIGVKLNSGEILTESTAVHLIQHEYDLNVTVNGQTTTVLVDSKGHLKTVADTSKLNNLKKLRKFKMA